MGFPDDLLGQAEHLAKLDRKRPKQASLRRAISAAYYALFHRLISEASWLPVKDYQVASCIARAPSHAKMNEVSKLFANGKLPKAFGSVASRFPVKSELKQVAQAFVDLQQARHDADYDLAKNFRRGETLAFVERVRQEFRDWDAVRKERVASIYLACLLIGKDLDRGR